MSVRSLFALSLLAVLTSGCFSDSDSPPEVGAGAPLSIVVLGDSIASGEGLNYGYTYDTGFPNHWTGGTDNPTWQGAYQLCHDSVLAYGDVLASMVQATLAKFACTGSTYDNGFSFDRWAAGVFYRPAQFGNWLGKTNLNAAYDSAKPDVVIITLGADDVSFVEVFTYCALGITDPAEDLAIARDPNPAQRLRRGFAKKFPTPEAWLNRRKHAVESSFCTAANPGASIQTLFWDLINSGQIAGNYKAIVAAIQARGAAAGKVPKIIFTTYHQPLPSPGQSDECLDMGDLERDEIDYLITLQNTLKNTLIAAVSGMNGVSVADISNVVKGHEFCTSDPWTYGLSVLALNDDSLAPFHPIPVAQAAIAAIVKQSLPAN